MNISRKKSMSWASEALLELARSVVNHAVMLVGLEDQSHLDGPVGLLLRLKLHDEWGGSTSSFPVLSEPAYIGRYCRRVK